MSQCNVEPPETGTCHKKFILDTGTVGLRSPTRGPGVFHNFCG